MWVRFTETFRWKPTPMTTKVWPAGMVDNVPKAIGEAAIEQGKAVEAEAERHGKRTASGRPLAKGEAEGEAKA